MSNAWFWIVPASEQSDTTRPSNAVLVQTTTGSAVYNAINSQNAFTYKKQSYTVFQGPYTTINAARSAPGAASGLNAALVDVGAALGGAIGVTSGAGTSDVAAGVSAGSSVSSALTAWQQTIANFLNDFTQENTWLRIGEGVIGIVLIAAGVSHLTGLSKVAATAAKAAVVA